MNRFDTDRMFTYVSGYAAARGFESSWDGERLVLQSFDHSDEIVTGFGCCVDYDLINSWYDFD